MTVHALGAPPARLEQPDVEAAGTSAEEPPAAERDSAGRRRFVIAASAGSLFASIPFLWVLFDLWALVPNSFPTLAFARFYDIQARAMLAGHLHIPQGSIGIEAFVHNGQQYTYFGIFPSLLRMPVLLITHALDGRLTAPSMLLAWIVTAIFTSLLVWRVRVLARGRGALSKLEAVALGGLVATVLAGSVLMYLAASPFVYHEDVAWSVALTVGALYALLGVIERQTWARVSLAGVLILAASLNRAPTGYACILGGLLVAALLLAGWRGRDARRWSIPVAGGALVALAAASVINWIKFGSAFGLPIDTQIWTMVNAHRQQFLAANHGSEIGLQFLSTTLVSYWSPLGIRWSTVFPFVTLPASPPTAVGSALLDATYPTASVPASMPLLFLLAAWGVFAAFRRGAGRLALARAPLLAGLAATGAVMLFGYIADRYLGDFVPVLVLGAAVGLVDIWRRLVPKDIRMRGIALALLGLLAGYEIFANVAAAVGPLPNWTPDQASNYLTVQRVVSDHTGHPLNGMIERGATLPYWAPLGDVFVVDDCAGLYLSTGYDYRYFPIQQFEHQTWIPLQLDARPYALHVTIDPSLLHKGQQLPLFTIGRTRVWIRVAAAAQKIARVFLFGRDPGFTNEGGQFTVLAGRSYTWALNADPQLHQLTVSMGTRRLLTSGLSAGGSYSLPPASATGGAAPLSLALTPLPPHSSSLCRSLIGGA